jgi:hypothetical protein
VQQGKKSQGEADREIRAMAAVYDTLKELRDCREAFAREVGEKHVPAPAGVVEGAV